MDAKDWLEQQRNGEHRNDPKPPVDPTELREYEKKISGGGKRPKSDRLKVIRAPDVPEEELSAEMVGY